MFGLFKGKSELEKLNIKYKALLSEAHRLSTIDRQLSDKKVSEANDVLEKIEHLKKSE
ncbi:Lacal_2735 family protein [Salibacteraceae bacterium]|nr:Lacal_2735 family protein [Salibacteraceae bacterium]MDB0002144.1 Lacal_2735 family protein [Salibacteraceae bacterium]MDB4105250.1 Lacal_2735 family protein [Salibacteraceae bacterium]MDB9709974.1 Lacal_2735 family protein [Salibacteraceae bacterium]MDC1304803.1 Lacal_2735 family protein [Salibacteraceae bacterium]